MGKFNFNKTVKSVVKSKEFKAVKKQVVIGAKKGAKTFNRVGGAVVKTIEEIPKAVGKATDTFFSPGIIIAGLVVGGLVLMKK